MPVKPKVVIPITPDVLALPKGEYGAPHDFPAKLAYEYKYGPKVITQKFEDMK